MFSTINHLQLSFKNDYKQLRIDSFKTLQSYEAYKNKKLKNQGFPQLQVKAKRYATISDQHQVSKFNSKKNFNPQQCENYSVFKKKTNRNLKYYINRHKLIQLQAEQVLRKSNSKQEQNHRLPLSLQTYYVKKCKDQQRTINQQNKILFQNKDNNKQQRQNNQRNQYNPNKSYYLKMKRIIHQNVKNRFQNKKLEILTQKNQQKLNQSLKRQTKFIMNSQRSKKYKDLSLKQLIYQKDQHECPLSPSLQKKAQGMRLNFKNLVQMQPFMLESIDDSNQNLMPYLRLNQNKSDIIQKQKASNPSIVPQAQFANFVKYKKRKCKFLTNRKTSNKTQRLLEQINS